MLKSISILYMFATFVLGRNLYEDTTIVFDPVELMNKVVEERRKTEHDCSTSPAITLSTTEARVVTELNDAETSLKKRKVWSRWGKWGKCSVTCGGGAMTRQRVCAGGRCAPGELEEQRRPCALLPCATTRSESHDGD